MPPLYSWAPAILVALLIASAVTDVLRGKIYNVLTYPAIAAGVLGHTLLGGLQGEAAMGSIGLIGSLAGLAAGFLPMLVVWMAGGIGGGDAKIMAAIGALMGPAFTLDTLFWGLAAALVMAIIVMIRRRILRRTLGRVGRFLMLAFVRARPADPAEPDSPKIAFGLALCIGAAAALVMHAVGAPGFLGS